MKITPALQAAHDAFTTAYFNSREWNRLVEESIKQYGDIKGTHISGIYADHFPEEVKVRLRNCAKLMTINLDLAFALRPKRVRIGTMIKLKNYIKYKLQWENLVITKINQGATKSEAQAYADECIAMKEDDMRHKCDRDDSPSDCDENDDDICPCS